MYVILFVIVLILNVFGVIVRYDIASVTRAVTIQLRLESRVFCLYGKPMRSLPSIGLKTVMYCVYC